MAFHPDFSANRYFYVNYTFTNLDTDKLYTRVSRFEVTTENLNLADPDTELVLLEVEQPYSNHNGGDIHFGPDGYLYIGLGDGGSRGDPEDYARDLGVLLGKMLRIDIDHSSPGNGACGLVANYGIPGSYRYRGPIAGMIGLYFYADFCTGNVWHAGLSSGNWSTALWRTADLSISSFGEDEAR